MGSTTVKPISAELDELREQIAALTGRLEELSRIAGTAPIAAQAPVIVPQPAPVEAKQEDVITEDLLIALSAAVAAYLGKRAPIRHVRLLGSTAWGQQGRVNVQASHGLNVQHTK